MSHLASSCIISSMWQLFGVTNIVFACFCCFRKVNRLFVWGQPFEPKPFGRWTSKTALSGRMEEYGSCGVQHSSPLHKWNALMIAQYFTGESTGIRMIRYQPTDKWSSLSPLSTGGKICQRLSPLWKLLLLTGTLGGFLSHGGILSCHPSHWLWFLGKPMVFGHLYFRKPLDKQTCERTKCLLAICELICWTSDKTPLMISGSLLIWLVVWTPLKNISQLGWLLFPIYGKIKMFQTTNQNISYPYFVAEHVLFPLFVLQENSINHGQA